MGKISVKTSGGKVNKVSKTEHDYDDDDDNVEMSGDFKKINLLDIIPDPDQPRKTFEEESIIALSESIKRDGLLQPPVVRRQLTKGKPTGKYLIVAGERRFRALNILLKSGNKSFNKIDCKVIADNDKRIAEKALIENIQREDLNPIEISNYLIKLQSDSEMSVSEIAKSINKSVSTVKNFLRLQHLPKHIKKQALEDAKSFSFKELIDIAGENNPNSTGPKITEKESSNNKKSKKSKTKEFKGYQISIEIYCPTDISNEKEVVKLANIAQNLCEDHKLLKKCEFKIREPKMRK